MKKRYLAALAAVAADAGAWCVHRDKKYPLRKELRFANKLAVPGSALNLKTAGLANRALAPMALTLPALPQRVESRGTQIFSQDGTPVRLTLYQSEGLDWAAPCLVYCHGGGFCLGDAGYAAQYAQGTQCVVVFVHYRTSDAAPFPAAFEDYYAALRWVWEQAPRLRLDRARIAVGGDSAGRCFSRRLCPADQGRGRPPAVLPAAGLPCDRLPDGFGLHGKIHGQSVVERRVKSKNVGAIPPEWGLRDAGVRRTYAAP